MSGTVRTIQFLQSSEFQDGQAAGAIVPGRVRDLVATLQSLTGSVATPEQYGAAGDGVTNDTAAFNSALTNAKTVILGPKKYLVGGVVMNSGNVLIGFTGINLYDDTNNYISSGPVRPQLIAPAGTTNVLSVGTAGQFAILSVVIDGQFNAQNGISDQTISFISHGYVWNCTIVRCSGSCIGGNSFSSIWAGRIDHCELGSSGNGISGPSDLQITGCDFSSCTNAGINAFDGTGASSVANCRFEWSGVGIDFNGATAMAVAGCYTDSNTGAAFQFRNGANNITVTGCANRFNGSAGTAGARSHFYLDGCSHIVLAGNTGKWGNVGNPNGPPYAIEFAGTNTFVSMVGNDFSNVGGTAASIGTNPTSSRAAGNLGYADF